MIMYVIKAQVNQFSYYLRFDKSGEGLAEGLRDNADRFSKKAAEEIIAGLDSIWPLSVEKLPKPPKSLVDLS